MTIWTAVYWDDWLGDTQDLSLLEHGAYFRLVAAYYASEGRLSVDRKRLYRICGAVEKAERQAVEDVVVRYFGQDEDGWLSHGRCDYELQRAAKKSQSARKAANVRWHSDSDAPASAPASADAQPAQCYPQGQGQPQPQTEPQPPGEREREPAPTHAHAHAEADDIDWKEGIDREAANYLEGLFSLRECDRELNSEELDSVERLQREHQDEAIREFAEELLSVHAEALIIKKEREEA